MKRKILLLAIILSLAAVLLIGCTTDADDGKQPVNIAVGEFVKIEYYRGEELSLGGAQIIVSYADGWSRRIDITPDMISGYDSNTVGEQQVTISYKGLQTNISVNVLELTIQKIEAVEVNRETGKVTIARPIRVVEGGQPDYSRIALRVSYESISVIQNTITAQMISGYSPESCPPSDTPYTVTIKYGGKTANLLLYVEQKAVQELLIEADGAPRKLQYFYNNPAFNNKISAFNHGKSPDEAIAIDEGTRYTEVFDPTGLKITVVYNNGTREIVPYSAINPADIAIEYNFNKASAESAVTITYRNKQVVLYVKVVEPITTNMEITRMPSTRGRYSFVSLDASEPAPQGTAVELPQYGIADTTKQYIIRTPESNIGTDDIVEGDTIEWHSGRASIFYNDGTVLNNVPLDFNDILKTCSAFNDLNGALEATGAFTINVSYSNSNWTPLEVGIRVVPRAAIKMFLAASSVNSVVTKNYFVGDEIPPELIKYNAFYDNGTFLFGDISPEEWNDPANWSSGKNTAGVITYETWSNPSSWTTDADLNVTYNFTKSAGMGYGWDYLGDAMLSVPDSEKCTEPGLHSLAFQIDGVLSKTITVSVAAVVPVSVSLIQDYSYYFLVDDNTTGFFENTLRNEVKAFVKYNNGTSAQKTLSSETVSIYKDGEQVYSFFSSDPYVFEEAGEYQIRVDVDGVSEVLALYVSDNAVEPKVNSIEIEAEPSDSLFDHYLVFESKLDQFAFKLTYSDGTQKTLYLADGDNSSDTVFADYKFSGEARTENDVLLLCDKNRTGIQEVMFRYRGCSVSYPINIIGRWERSIQIIRLPKQLYVYGVDTAIDISGLKVRILYNDGTTVEETDFSDSKWSFVFPTLSLLYEEYYSAKTVTVILDGVHRKLKRDYTIEYVNGGVSSIGYDENQQIIVGYESGEPVHEYLLKNYTDYDGTMRKMLNVTYGRDLDLTSFALTVSYTFTDSEGEQRTVSSIRGITSANINYDKSVNYKDAQGNIIYTRLLTISYCGKTTPVWLHLDIERTLVGIEIVDTPSQLNYTVGQNIDLRGGLVRRTFLMGDGSYSYDFIYMTNPETSVEYNNGAFPIGGSQMYETRPVTINYNGFSDGFDVITYKKLTANLEYVDIVYRYGVAAEPKISVTESGIQGFELPDITWQYGIEHLVGGVSQTVWTDVCPDKPGAYAIRVSVQENEYYDAYQESSRILYIMKKLITVNGKDFSKYYSEAEPDFNSPNPSDPSEKGYYFYGFSGSETPLVGNDIIQLRLFRAGADANENVRFGGSGEILGYTISCEIVAGDNQNDYYIIDFVPGKLTILPLTILGSITFTGYDGLREDGAEHGVTAYYLDSNNMRVLIDQKDIIYTYKDEYGQTQTVTKTIIENGVPVVVNCPPALAGTYTATIAPNYNITGNNYVVFTINP